MRDRFQRQEFLAVMIPSMMPPPAPWKMFIFASGVFEMRIPVFLLAVFVGRMLRWLALSLLVLKLGPGAVDLVARHAVPVVIAVGVLAVIGFAWWWIRKKRSGKLLEG
jgi:membrane protein DedA with SNARE-associated domain